LETSPLEQAVDEIVLRAQFESVRARVVEGFRHRTAPLAGETEVEEPRRRLEGLADRTWSVMLERNRQLQMRQYMILAAPVDTKSQQLQAIDQPLKTADITPLGTVADRKGKISARDSTADRQGRIARWSETAVAISTAAILGLDSSFFAVSRVALLRLGVHCHSADQGAEQAGRRTLAHGDSTLARDQMEHSAEMASEFWTQQEARQQATVSNAGISASATTAPAAAGPTRPSQETSIDNSSGSGGRGSLFRRLFGGRQATREAPPTTTTTTPKSKDATTTETIEYSGCSAECA